MQETLQLREAKQLEALTHPFRIEIIQALRSETKSVSQLARELGSVASRVRYHVKVLEAAGIVELAETRPRGRVVEKRYCLTARRFEASSELFSAAGVQTAFADHLIGKAVQEALETLRAEGRKPEGRRRPGMIAVLDIRADADGLQSLQEQLSELSKTAASAAERTSGAPYRFLLVMYPASEPTPGPHGKTEKTENERVDEE